MAISHIKVDPQADFTGTVTIFNSAGATGTVEASAMVRPSDWNSVHNQFLTLSGNTAGASTMSGSNLIFQGGNNVTLSANGDTLVFSAGAGGGGMGISAGTQSVSTGTMVFADSNGLTFGMSGSSQITGSYSQSTHSHATAAYSGSNGSFTANTVTFGSSNGAHFYTTNGSIVASYTVPAAQTGISGIANSQTTYTSGTVSFSELGAVTIRSTTGNQFQISVNAQSVVPGIQTIAFANTTFTTGAVSFSNANGISFGSSGAQVTASHNALTTAALSNHSHGVSFTSGSVGFQTLSFTNSNGISFNSGTQGIFGSHNAITTGRASTDAIGLNTAQTNVTWTVNSSGLSFNAAGYAGTTTAITGGAAITMNSAGFQFNGAGLAGTGTTFQGNNASGSMTLNSAGLNLSVSVAAPGAAAENNWVHLLGANTAGDTTASGSTIGLSGLGVTLSGTNGSVIVVSGGGGGAATIGGAELFQLNNATTFTTLGLNSVYFQRFIMDRNVSFNYLEFRASGSTVSSTNSQRGAHTYDYGLYSRQAGASSTQYALISSSRFIMDVSISSNVSAAYTISQGAASITSSSAGTALLSGLSGFKHLYFPYTSTITAGGEYALAVRMSSATSIGTNAFRIALKQMSMMNNLTIGKIGTGGVTATNASHVGDFAQGVYSVTSSALLGTVALSGLTNAISQMRMYVQFEV